MDTFAILGFVFGMMGFIFSINAYSRINELKKKVEALTGNQVDEK